MVWLGIRHRNGSSASHETAKPVETMPEHIIVARVMTVVGTDSYIPAGKID